MLDTRRESRLVSCSAAGTPGPLAFLHSRLQWALPDLNSKLKLQIAVGTPRPQQQAPDRGGHSWSSTASRHSRTSITLLRAQAEAKTSGSEHCVNPRVNTCAPPSSKSPSRVGIARSRVIFLKACWMRGCDVLIGHSLAV